MIKSSLRVAAWALLGLNAYFTLCPFQYRPSVTVHHQAERAFAYFLVGLLLAAGYPRNRVMACLVLVMAAIALEFGQMFAPGRDAHLRDLMAKVLGAIIGTATCWGLDQLMGEQRTARSRPIFEKEQLD